MVPGKDNLCLNSPTLIALLLVWGNRQQLGWLQPPASALPPSLTTPGPNQQFPAPAPGCGGGEGAGAAVAPGAQGSRHGRVPSALGAGGQQGRLSAGARRIQTLPWCRPSWLQLKSKQTKQQTLSSLPCASPPLDFSFFRPQKALLDVSKGKHSCCCWMRDL